MSTPRNDSDTVAAALEDEIPEVATDSQRQALRRIWDAAQEKASNGGLSEVELKELEVEPNHTNGAGLPVLSIVIEMGRVGDEETLASVFCRTRGHFFVGSHGGIEAAGVGHSPDFEGKRTKARREPLIYGWKR